jgi:hypothetical protein
VVAVGRERTEEEKRRRHLFGDKGAKFSQGKRLCLLGGGDWMRNHYGYEGQFSM